MECPNCKEKLEKVGVSEYICSSCKEGFIKDDSKKLTLVGVKDKEGFIKNITEGLEKFTSRCKSVLEDSGFIKEENENEEDEDFF